MRQGRNPNTTDYWNQRFASGDWAEKGGPSQTQSFAMAYVPRLNLSREFKGSICDFGCGAGDAFPVYREAFPQALLRGFDFSESAIAECRARYGDFAQFDLGDARSVPASDVVICSNVLEHVDDDLGIVDALLERCSRMFVIVPYRESPLSYEHVRAYDESALRTFSPVRADVFLSPGWSEFGSDLIWNVYAKNLVKRLLNRPTRIRRRQILFELLGRQSAAIR